MCVCVCVWGEGGCGKKGLPAVVDKWVIDFLLRSLMSYLVPGVLNRRLVR